MCKKKLFVTYVSNSYPNNQDVPLVALQTVIQLKHRLEQCCKIYLAKSTKKKTKSVLSYTRSYNINCGCGT